MYFPSYILPNESYNYSALCNIFGMKACSWNSLMRFNKVNVCQKYQDACLNNKMPKDFNFIQYDRTMNEIDRLEYKMHDSLRLKLEDYMNCTIEYLDEKKSCNMKHVMGSFYSKDELPSYCYTLYSLWGSPDQQREQIQKGARIILEFNLKASGRDKPITFENVTAFFPMRNLPTSPSVQIAFHTPYFLPSPYVIGSNYQGGKAYEVQLTMDKAHLLRSPYQTNCTDYLEKWKTNGGKGPISQKEVVNECLAESFNKQLDCVPLNVDYPHTNSICGKLTNRKGSNPKPECIIRADEFSQPCEFITYTAEREEVDITVHKIVDSHFLFNKDIQKKIKLYDCDGNKSWNPECSSITVAIIFERFEITTLKYYPKFESLELFSAIGGYMGIWLGISLVAVYDFMFTIVGFCKKWRTKEILPGKNARPSYGTETNQLFLQSNHFQKNIHNF